jgi:P63C domain
LLTNGIVYDRLAPGFLDKLKRVNPKYENGRRKHKNFQWLTLWDTRSSGSIGWAVIALMTVRNDWPDFKPKLDIGCTPIWEAETVIL